MIEYILSSSANLPLSSDYTKANGSVFMTWGEIRDIGVKVLSVASFCVVGIDSKIYNTMGNGRISKELILMACDNKYYFYITCNGDVVDHNYEMVVKDKNIVSYYISVTGWLYFVTDEGEVLSCTSPLVKKPRGVAAFQG